MDCIVSMFIYVLHISMLSSTFMERTVLFQRKYFSESFLTYLAVFACYSWSERLPDFFVPSDLWADVYVAVSHAHLFTVLAI